MGASLAQNTWELLVLAVFAVIANASALVWGPNMLYLMQRKRALSRSIAYTLGRALTLTLASGFIVSAVLAGGKSVNVLADEVTAVAKNAHPLLDILIGLAIVGLAWWVWKNPPSFLSHTPPVPGDDDRARIWPAFVLGVTILFANILEFAWQILGLGGLVVSAGRNYALVGLAVVIWTVMGTATLWAPAIAHVLAPEWANERFEKLTARIPAIKPWEIALPLAIAGVAFVVFGVWMALK